MIKLELTAEQAVAVRYALLLHTKDDSVSFPSERVKLIREAITTPVSYTHLTLPTNREV